MLPLVTYMENQYILGSFQSVSMVMTLRVAVLAHGASRVGFDSSHRETGAGYIRFANLTKLPRFEKVPMDFLVLLIFFCIYFIKIGQVCQICKNSM